MQETDRKQSDEFKRVATKLGVDEDEAAFNAKLKKIATVKPPKAPKK